jgi:hypothetical protein
MRSKTLVVVIAFAVMGVSSTAIAKGGGGGGGAGGKGGSAVGHFGHGHFFGHHFRRNQAFLGGWGWGPYGEGGYTDTTVVVSPRFPAADVTGSVAATPCHWNSETFTVPSSSGGNRPVEVVSCR